MPVTTTLNAADKPNLVDDERLDLPDFNAVFELLVEYMVRSFGALFGGARKIGDPSTLTVSGSLNTITFDTSTLGATVIGGPAMLLNFRQNATGDDEGQVVWYDSADPAQQTTINLTSFEAGAQTPYIWAKRYDIPDDADTRRKWASGAETVFSLATRQRHRVEWAAEVGDRRITTGDDQWFVVAQITGWSGSVPTIVTWHPFDAGSPTYSGKQDSWIYGRLFSQDTKSIGINQALHLILTTLSQFRKVDKSVHPFLSAPPRGLDELDTLLLATIDAISDFGFGEATWIRLLSDGVGGWSSVSGDELVGASGVVGITPSMSGWRVDVEMSRSIKHVQITSGAYPPAAGPQDIVVQYEHDVAVPSNKGITIYVQTMDNLINTTSFSWGTAPAGSPPAGVRIDLLVAG